MREHRSILVAMVATTALVDWALKAAAHAGTVEILINRRPVSPGLVIFALVAVGATRDALRGTFGRLGLYGWGLIVGAALGNIGERVVRGGVTDFIPLGDYLASPADLAFGAGLVLLLAGAVAATVRRRRAPQDHGFSPGLRHVIAVPASADGRPGLRLRSFSRSLYEPMAVDDDGVRCDLRVFLTARSTLGVVCLHPGRDPAADATLALAGFRQTGRIEEEDVGPLETARFQVAYGSSTLVEWRFSHDGWVFAAGALIPRGEDVGAALERAREVLRTWEWAPAARAAAPV